MWRSNPTWGSPRIVGEPHKIGIDIAKSTVEKYRVRPLKPPSPPWKTFLKHHVQDLVALDFFPVPTGAFRLLFVLVILAHDRRRVVHSNISEPPTSQGTVQQVGEAFPWDEAPPYLLRDRDSIYGASFRQRVRNAGLEEVVITPRSPWHNPSVERLIGSPAGVLGSCHRPACAADAAHPDSIFPFLPSFAHRYLGCFKLP